MLRSNSADPEVVRRGVARISWLVSTAAEDPDANSVAIGTFRLDVRQTHGGQAGALTSFRALV
jgi:hypothetical protein